MSKNKSLNNILVNIGIIILLILLIVIIFFSLFAWQKTKDLLFIIGGENISIINVNQHKIMRRINVRISIEMAEKNKNLSSSEDINIEKEIEKNEKEASLTEDSELQQEKKRYINLAETKEKKHYHKEWLNEEKNHQKQTGKNLLIKTREE